MGFHPWGARLPPEEPGSPPRGAAQNFWVSGMSQLQVIAIGHARETFAKVSKFSFLGLVCVYKLTRTFPLMFHFAQAFRLVHILSNGEGR